MSRRRVGQPELRPVYVPPVFQARERAAMRAFHGAAYRGERFRPKAAGFDPLWMRLGLRVSQIQSRAGWVVSNPLYDEVLRRNPSSDPSLPGPGWLREVYLFRYTDLVTLPRVQQELERRREARRVAEAPVATQLPEPPNASAQQSLFVEACH